jgi:hypothetical protein
MSGSVLGALSRRAAFVTDRQASLAILGAAALTSATVGPSRAKKKHGKKKNKNAVSVGASSPPLENKCAAQRPQCLAFVKENICHRVIEPRRALAIDPGTEEECNARLAPCCDYFAGCQLAAGMLCLATPAPRPQLPE